jgi:NADH-quinone oxidoreductase subunit N
VTLLLGAAPKLAAFAITLRLLAEGLLPMAHDWQQMLLVLAVMSLAIGNFTAIAQTNLKRMLAYSTIAQMGFVLLGLLSGTVDAPNNTLNAAGAATAYGASMYYVITYVFTTLGTFGVIMLLARNGFEAEELADFKGLGKRSPIFALVMTLFMFSLAGVPPLMGFMAKYSVLASVLATGQLWLTIAAVLFSLIGAFYYLRVVKMMWFDEPTDTNALVVHGDMRVVLALNGVLVLALGVMPESILAACASAITKTLAS